MIILLNKYSNNGGGLQKWKHVRTQLERKYIGQDYTLVSEFEGFYKRLRAEFERGERILIAAGGDGTVNFLLNCIMKLKKNEQREIVFGAIGLGSSNDFHKPFAENRYLNGNVPFKLDYDNATQHNIAQVDFQDEHQKWQRKYFIINCSIGIIAYANHLFNSKEIVINFLKPKWVLGTIWYAGLKAVFHFPNIPATINVGDEGFKTKVTNLSVFISPHFSGNFRYDFDVSNQDDCLGAALCERMGLLARLKTFLSLAKARFSHLPGTRVWKTPGIEICLDSPTPLELDGEVYLARKINVNLLKGGLRVCR
jgi:diacylglycerol kinase family enzyme